jgi:hypothetical protein
MCDSGKEKHLKKTFENKNYKFKWVENFKYLGGILHEDNNHHIHLQERIKSANKINMMIQSFFKNKNISKKLKLTLQNTTIGKMLI